MPRSRSTGGVAGSWSGCSCANCNKRRNVGLRSEEIELLAEDIADLLDQGDYRYEDHPEIEPGTPSWIFDANTAAARQLVQAVSAGDADRLTSLWRELELEENIEDFYRCEAAGQLLILAAQLGKAGVLRPLLSLGASLDAVDEHGHQGPALLHAASGGNVNVVRALLEAGASPDQQDVRGQSALIVAVLADRAAVAEVLLSAGADPNRADSFGATPIWYCGQFNALDCIPVLGLHGADAFHVDPQTQDDPVEAALKQGYTRAAESLRRLQQRQRMRERQKSGAGAGGAGGAQQRGGAAAGAAGAVGSEQELKRRQQQADAAMAALLAELEATNVSGGGGGKQGGGKGKKQKQPKQQQQQQQHQQQQQQQQRGEQHGDQQQPAAAQSQQGQQGQRRGHLQQPASPSAAPSPSSSGPLASLIAVLHPQSEAVVLSAAEAARSNAAAAAAAAAVGGGGKKTRPKRGATTAAAATSAAAAAANGNHQQQTYVDMSVAAAAAAAGDSAHVPPAAAAGVAAQSAEAAAAAAVPTVPEREDPNAELRRQWEALLAEAAACGSDVGLQEQLAALIEAQMPGVAEAGVSVKYGKKLLGKLQRAPAAAAALAASTAEAAEVLAPGFEDAMAAAEAAERRADPAAALPDDLFSDEPLPAARQPSAAERRAGEAEAGLEAALADARSLRAFLQESALEQAEAALAELQRRRQQREQAAAAAAAAAAAPHQLPTAPLSMLPANGTLVQLPLLQQPLQPLQPPVVGVAALPPPTQQAASAAAAAAVAAAAAAQGLHHHDGLSPENECCICLGDQRRVLCVPCGHMCICAHCMPVAHADGKCPLCRLPLQDLVQIF